jgi:TfoX N-terminal domain
MAFDPGMAQRIRDVLGERPGVTEKKMFGGLAFLLHGHMFIGLAGEKLMARIGPEAYPRALRMKHVREMDFTGRPMKGYVFIDDQGVEADADLEYWVNQCAGFVATLPIKTAPKKAAARKAVVKKPGAKTAGIKKAAPGKVVPKNKASNKAGNKARTE